MRTDLRDRPEVGWQGTLPLHRFPTCQRNFCGSSSHWLTMTILPGPGALRGNQYSGSQPSIPCLKNTTFLGSWRAHRAGEAEGCTALATGWCCSLEQMPQLSAALPFIPGSQSPSLFHSSTPPAISYFWLAFLLTSRAPLPFCDGFGNVSPTQLHTAPLPLLDPEAYIYIPVHICPLVLGLNLTGNKIVKFFFCIFQALELMAQHACCLEASLCYPCAQYFPQYGIHTEDRCEDFR